MTHLLIVCQLLFSPIAYAQPYRDNYVGTDGMSGGSNSTYNDYAEGAYYFSNFINQMASSYTGAMQGNQDNYSIHRQNIDSILSLTPEQPGTYPAAFSNCLVLPSRGNQPAYNASCKKATHQEILEGYAQAMIDEADENMNELLNFSTESNDRTEFRGATCYQEAIAGLANQLNQREEQIQAYLTRLDQIMQKFELDSKETLGVIKQNDAILNGPCKECKEKDGVKKDYLGKYKYENAVLDVNDAGKCGSWFTKDAISKAGQKGGLIGIKDELVSSKIQPAEEFLSRERQITNDITSITKLLQKNFGKSDGNSVDASKAAIRTSFFSNSSPALTKAINRFKTNLSTQFEDLKTNYDISTITSGSDSSTAKLIVNKIDLDPSNLKSIEQEIITYKRKEQAQCVQNLIASNFSKDFHSFMSGFRDPNVSKSKSRDADNSLANSIATDISNLSNMDLEEFIKRVKVEEANGTNSRKIMTTGRTFQFNGKTIGASTPLRPSQLLGVFTQNCQAKFEKEATSNGLSKQAIIDNLKKYATERRNIQIKGGTSLLMDLRKDLLTCPSDSATGSAAATCDDKTLSTQSDNFCVATARRCSSNVYACKSKMEAKVTALETEQKVQVDNYKAQAKAASDRMLAEVSAMQDFMIQEARKLDAQLNIGTLTGMPKLQLDLVGENFLRDDVRSDLALEDPQKYLKALKKQISGEGGKREDSLLGKLEEQRLELVGQNGDDPSSGLTSGKGRLGAMADRYVANYQSAISNYQTIISDCENSIAQAQERESQEAQRTAETNEQLASACDAIDAFNANPLEGDVAEVAGDAAAAVRIAASLPNPGRPLNAIRDRMMIDKIRNFNQECAESQGGYGSRNVSVIQICSILGGSSEPEAGLEAKVHEFFSNPSLKCEILNSCAAIGIGESCSSRGNRDLAGESLDYCGESEKPLEGDLKICISVADKEKLIATTKTGECVIGSIQENPTLTDIKNALKNSGKPASLIQCAPGSGSERNISKTKTKIAEQLLEDQVAAFNCTQAKNGVGQVQLSICGSEYSGFLSEKGFDPRLWGDLATSAGQAFAQ